MKMNYLEAKNLLLHKQFMRKGKSGLINYVTDVTVDTQSKAIRVGYKTINHNKHSNGSLELNEFLGMHIIQF